MVSIQVIMLFLCVSYVTCVNHHAVTAIVEFLMDKRDSDGLISTKIVYRYNS